MSGSIREDGGIGGARRAGAELGRIQRLDGLAAQIEMENLRQDELAAQMQL